MYSEYSGPLDQSLVGHAGSSEPVRLISLLWVMLGWAGLGLQFRFPFAKAQ